MVGDLYFKLYGEITLISVEFRRKYIDYPMEMSIRGYFGKSGEEPLSLKYAFKYNQI